MRRLTEKLSEMARHEALIKDEERKLEELVRSNEVRISEETDKQNSKMALDREIKSKKEEMSRVSEKLSENERKISQSQRSIDDCHRLRAHSEHVQAEAERKLVSELNRIEQERREKELKVEELNRELRKANLQNFVRETSGSKVTVLPPASEPSHRKESSTSSSNSANHVGQKIGVSQNANESNSGVWV